ncbi:MAG: phosphoglycerate dehydrogenase, partial [Bacteroidota bacterium]|nr:phosphoglycerate dehydrogenase [Bacteroidota bacterium]
GIWLKESKGSYELRGKTMGIIGHGNIGTQVSVLAESLGMKVIFYDIVTKLPLGNAEARKTMKELVSQSDIITLHVPDTEQTRMLINKTVIKQMKKGAILLNYARGEVVDLDALAKAIEEGNISGAAVDVFPLEPEKNGDHFSSPLQNMPNVLLTPHIGGSTEEAQENIGEDVSNKLYQYLEMGVTTGSHTIPELSLPQHPDSHRILHIHNNVPGVLSEINTRLSKHHINILTQYLKTNDNIGYVVLDVDKKLSAEAIRLLKDVKNTIKTRLLY